MITDTSMNNDQDKKELSELIYVCRKLREKGLVNATHGNISVRVGDVMYITPTGCDLESVTEDELVAVKIADGTVISDGKPSQEWEMHLLTYQERPDVGGIVHAHSPKSVAVGCFYENESKNIVPCYTLSFALFTKTLPMVGYYKAGSHELATHAAAVLKDHPAVLLAHHGLITAQKSVRSAYYRLEEIEENCGIALSIGLTGRDKLDPARI